MKYINILIWVIFLAFYSVSCTDSDDYKWVPEKPGDVSLNEYLNSFDLLKTYVNSGTDSPFKLGAGLPASEFLNKELPYSMVCTNFHELETGNSFTPVSITGEDGTVDVSSFQMLVDEAQQADIILYGSDLLSHRDQRAGYLNELIAPVFIPGEARSGTFLVNDFESDIPGTTYPMTGNSAATVIPDPAGQSGNVLNIGNAQTPANQSFPQFNITLPDGVTLGNCVTMIMDFYATGSTGLYGSGMRMGINDNQNATYDNASSFGCPDGSWGRDKISLPFSAINLTDAEKQLTTFTLKIGSATGSGNYYIDNIRIYWEVTEGDQTIEKTPEEKKSILSEELNTWIGKMIDAGGESVKAWNIVADPLDKKVDDANTFHWKDYLGESGYARLAVKMARDTAQMDLDLFVSHLMELNASSVQQCEDLIALIETWEADNRTQIDGINIMLHSSYSKDVNQQQTNETFIGEILTKLASSGKLIRISDLKISIADVNGVLMRSSGMTSNDRYLAAGYITFILKKYMDIIPADKRYGISLGQMSETSNGTTVCPWDTYNNRTDIYVGIVEGLQNN